MYSSRLIFPRISGPIVSRFAWSRFAIGSITSRCWGTSPRSFLEVDWTKADPRERRNSSLILQLLNTHFHRCKMFKCLNVVPVSRLLLLLFSKCWNCLNHFLKGPVLWWGVLPHHLLLWTWNRVLNLFLLGWILTFPFSFLLDRHRAKLEEFLPQLLDVPSESCPEIKPPPIMRPLSSRELCDRFVRAMELVNANQAVFKT